MRNIIAIALGLLLIVSAATATGNNNGAKVDVNSEASGMSVTNANVAQITNLDSNILGSDICAKQNVDIQIEDNSITGMGTTSGCNGASVSSLNNGMTNDIQKVDLVLNSTGCDNHDDQNIDLAQGKNCLTIGNLTQIAAGKIDDIGSNNHISQDSDASAGVFELDEGGCQLGSPNSLTNSDLKQVQILDACVTGNKNDVCQDDNQFATDNCLTNSKLFEQVALVSDTLGCDNHIDQQAVQEAEKNSLTDSWANKIICEDAQTAGNDNNADQFALEENQNNCLTLSSELQSIKEFSAELGCNNNVNQDVSFENQDNSMTGGRIVQETSVKTNV